MSPTTAPVVVRCTAKHRGYRDRCGVELRRVETGVPSGPRWGHLGRIRWTHWPRPERRETVA